MTLLLAALLVASDPAVAAQQPVAAAPAAATPAAAAPATKPTKPKKICKKEEAISGSRFANRVCLTEEEWAVRNEGMSHSSRSGYSAGSQE